MRLEALSAREQRLLAIGLLVLLVGLLVRLVIMPITEGFSSRAEQRRLLEMQIARNDRLAAAVPRLGRMALQQRNELRLFILTAPSAAKGAELLQERLRATAESVGGEVVASEMAEGAPDQLAMRADLRLTEPQLYRLLADLQNRPPYVSTGLLSVTAEDALLTGEQGQLAVRLELQVPFAAAAT